VSRVGELAAQLLGLDAISNGLKVARRFIGGCSDAYP
jgi:hypothetical protein